MWFCNVLGLCSGSFSEGRERLSTQGFHLCITTRVCCLCPPSCAGIRAPPADVGLFGLVQSHFGDKVCGMATGLLRSELGLLVSTHILLLCPPPNAEHPGTGRSTGTPPLAACP